MSMQDEIIDTPFWPSWLARVSFWVSMLVQSPWTPSLVSVGSCLAILSSAGGALLYTRLGELEAAAVTRLDEPAAQTAGLTPELDYTLAPDALREISMDAARAFNASLPFSTLPILSARPFIMPPQQLADYARALDCLTAAVYYEAASETAAGQAAVAQVVINRMRHPAFPKTICGVVFQGQERTTGCQFSFTCDGAMARVPSATGWARARAVAAAALNGAVASQVGMATHYHTDWVAPYWAERLVKMAQIDTHIFYRWTGAWGLPAAFTGRHAGVEPTIEKLSAMATYVEEPLEPVLNPTELENLVTVRADLAFQALPEPESIGPAEASGVEQAEVSTETENPPAAAVLVNPLAPAATAPAQRRSRIATPR